MLSRWSNGFCPVQNQANTGHPCVHVCIRLSVRPDGVGGSLKQKKRMALWSITSLDDVLKEGEIYLVHLYSLEV